MTTSNWWIYQSIAPLMVPFLRLPGKLKKKVAEKKILENNDR
jgi:hypothetical protein